MCGTRSLKHVVPDMVQGADQVHTWLWSAARSHVQPLKL
jgi:hypothetical protein